MTRHDEPVDAHVNNYLSGDGFAYCQECAEAAGDYVLVTDCPLRSALEGSDA